MNVFANCKFCGNEFNLPHFNSKCCSETCRKKCRALAIKKYKFTDKGNLARLKWVKSKKFKENEKIYRSNPKARELAVIRSTRCLKNSIYLQERKKERDKIYGKSEKGRLINKKSTKLYLATDKGKICRKNGKHRRRQLEKSGNIKAIEWARKLKEYNYCCAKCNTDSNIEMDHIIPLSKGGAHHIDNIQPLCRSCNASKGNKILWAI